MNNHLSPFVSVIIVDYKRQNPLLQVCLDHIAKQTYRDFEVLLLTDYPVKISASKLIKKFYGRYTGPAKKRDDGVKIARGKIVAFLDDDAYPSAGWLKAIVEDFRDSSVAGVGGPGVTPPRADWKEQASGWISASPLGAGPYSYRFFPGKRVTVDDYPSMNLAVRKSDFLAVGGFDRDFWPGEDTKLCLDLVHKLGKIIIYDPKSLVYHHRRPLWIPHLKQNGNFGIHRGYFARILPRTSARLSYFGPSILLVSVLVLFVLRTSEELFPEALPPVLLLIEQALVLGVLAYWILLFLNAIWIFRQSKSWFCAAVSIPGVVLTHLWYGARFIQGFFSFTGVNNSNVSSGKV